MKSLKMLVLLAMVVAASFVRAAESPQAPAANDPVARGKYIVNTSGCHDCHTPWHMTDKGPAPDMSRALSGHPESLEMPEAPALPPGPWIVAIGATNTAYAGPWGVSFTANLTPDPETGLGNWTGDIFIQAIRTGRHEGKGRPLLPPMPAAMIRNLHDEDLLSIFAYLQSLKPVRNRVPQPIDPPESW